MRDNMFRGVTTAMITPFLPDGSLDYEGLRKNTCYQLDHGVHGLLVLGTTGESPTLDEQEKERVTRTVIETVREFNSKARVMVGVGTNSTQKTIQSIHKAQEWGADALLIVAPYYNKPTQEGILAHFRSACRETDLPVVVYNIKSRTGVNIETATLARIAELPNVIGVKEASGDIQQMMDVLTKIPELAVYSGDDNLTFPLICLGGQGVISVASNLFPGEIVTLVMEALDGNLEIARTLHYRLLPLFKALFLETNPAPIKYAMRRRGFAAGPLRLPLVEMQTANQRILDTVLETLGEGYADQS